MRKLLDSILSSPVQTAPSPVQSVVGCRVMATSPFESGETVISQCTLLGGATRRALVTVPQVTVSAWSRSVL